LLSILYHKSCQSPISLFEKKQKEW